MVSHRYCECAGHAKRPNTNWPWPDCGLAIRIRNIFRPTCGMPAYPIWSVHRILLPFGCSCPDRKHRTRCDWWPKKATPNRWPACWATQAIQHTFGKSSFGHHHQNKSTKAKFDSIQNCSERSSKRAAYRIQVWTDRRSPYFELIHNATWCRWWPNWFRRQTGFWVWTVLNCVWPTEVGLKRNSWTCTCGMQAPTVACPTATHKSFRCNRPSGYVRSARNIRRPISRHFSISIRPKWNRSPAFEYIDSKCTHSAATVFRDKVPSERVCDVTEPVTRRTKRKVDSVPAKRKKMTFLGWIHLTKRSVRWAQVKVIITNRPIVIRTQQTQTNSWTMHSQSMCRLMQRMRIKVITINRLIDLIS